MRQPAKAVGEMTRNRHDALLTPEATHPQILDKQKFSVLLDKEKIRSALLAKARTVSPSDAEDIVQDVIVRALEQLHTYDMARYGVDGLANWLHAFLNQRLSFVKRRHKAREANCDPLTLSADVRWAQLNGHKERAALNDVELVAEARARIRLAPLSHREVLCISARLQGEAASQTAARLGIPIRNVQRYNKGALVKIRSVPVAVALEPDLDHYLFRLCSKTTVYFRPTSWGAGYARERLAKLK